MSHPRMPVEPRGTAARRRAMRRLLTPAILVLLAACTAAPGPTPSVAEALDGRAFLSVSATDGGKPRELVPRTRIRLEFSSGGLSASAGCNQMGGAFRLDGGRLVVDSLATTDMGCDRARMDQDTWLAQLLTTRPVLTLSDNDLRLERDGSAIVLLDRRVADPDLALVGPAWRVESLIAGQVVQSAPMDPPARLTFGPDGRVAIETGCNSGEGRFTAQAGSLRLSDIVLTKRACSGDSSMLEQAVLAVLRADRLAYAIEARSLTLSAPERGLDLRAE